MILTTTSVEEQLMIPKGLKYFICKNNPQKSFSLRLSNIELVSLTIKEFFQRVMLVYKIQPQNINQFIAEDSFESFYSFSYEPDKLIINSPLLYLPIYFLEKNASFNSQMMIEIQKLDGKSFKLSIERSSTETIKDLKQKISEKENIPIDEQRLMLGGKILDDYCTIDHYKIQNHSVLNLVLCLRGGSTLKMFVNLENEQSKQELTFSQSAPEYRVACKGINIEGYCKNRECKYYDKLVISQIGIKEVEVIQDLYNEILCPNSECLVPIKIQTCGFTNCQYLWSGLKVIDGKVKHVKSPLLSAQRGLYTRYNPLNKDGSSNLVEWKQLFIIAQNITESINAICFICKRKITEKDIMFSGICLDKQNHKCHDECLDKLKIIEGKCLLCLSVSEQEKSL